MGHGCAYRNKANNSREFWVDLSNIREEDYDIFCFLLEENVEMIGEEIMNMGYEKIDNRTYQNGLFELVLSFTHGNDILISLNPHYEDSYDYEDFRIFNLALANHERSYNKIARELIKSGLSLRISSGGYTSEPLEVQ